MVFEGVVRNGAVQLPPEVNLPDGTVVRVEANSACKFEHLLPLAGTWHGGDADQIVEDIYKLRSSAPRRPSFDS